MADEQNGQATATPETPIKKPTVSPELGFGASTSQTKQRLVNPDGTFNVRRRGVRRLTLADAYHMLITVSWTKFFIIVLSEYTLLNFFFGFIYFIIGTEHLTGMVGQTTFVMFWECFFYS